MDQAVGQEDAHYRALNQKARSRHLQAQNHGRSSAVRAYWKHSLLFL
jgi:hypothetical protein